MLIEGESVEFKSKLTDKLEIEIVAFLNSPKGGKLYIGINDDGQVIGLDEDIDLLQRKIVSRLSDGITPSTVGLFSVLVKEIDDKQIIEIDVSSGIERPYYITKRGKTERGCFLRVGASAQPMSQSMIDHYDAIRINRTICTVPTQRENLTFRILNSYYEIESKNISTRLAESLNFKNSESKYNYLAYLLADENSESIRVAKYAGTDRCDIIENNEYGMCCLVRATERVLEKFKQENTTFCKIVGETRHEENLMNKIALREIIINAIVHNDYLTGYTPVFEIFSDHVEITSFGGLVQGLDTDNFFDSGSRPRNRELMRVFRDAKLVEQLGSGIVRVLKYYDRNIFDIRKDMIRVSIPFLTNEEFQKTAIQRTTSVTNLFQ